MLPDRVSNPGPLTYESGALPIALRGKNLVKTNRDFNMTDLIIQWIVCLAYFVFCCSVSTGSEGASHWHGVVLALLRC